MNIEGLRTISLTVNIICMLMSIILASLYVSKRKIFTKENSIYDALLTSNIICLMLELIFYTLGYSLKNEFLVNIIEKSYFASNCIWMFINFLYIIVITNTDVKLKFDKNSDKIKKLSTVGSILAIILIIFILPIQNIYNEGRLVSSTGAATNFTFLLCFGLIALELIMVFMARKDVKKGKIAPLLVFFAIILV